MVFPVIESATNTVYRFFYPCTSAHGILVGKPGFAMFYFGHSLLRLNLQCGLILPGDRWRNYTVFPDLPAVINFTPWKFTSPVDRIFRVTALFTKYDGAVSAPESVFILSDFEPQRAFVTFC